MTDLDLEAAAEDGQGGRRNGAGQPATPGPQKRPTARRRRGVMREAEILAVTRRLISEGGYRKLTTLDIAKACGITEGAIFRYFATKQDLLAKVSELWFEELISGGSNLEHLTAPVDRLWHAIANFLTDIWREPELSRFVLMEMRYNADYRSTELYRLNRIYTGRIKSALQNAVDAGIFRDDIPVTLLRNMVIGTIEQATWSFLVSDNRTSEKGFEIQDVTNHIIAVICQGMETHVDRDRGQRLDRSLDHLEEVARKLDRLSRSIVDAPTNSAL